MNEITISSFGDLVEMFFDGLLNVKLNAIVHFLFFAELQMKILICERTWCGL
jgi:hypothetical protein